MKFVKGWVSLQLAYQSVRKGFQKRFYVYKQHEDGIKTLSAGTTCLSEQPQFHHQLKNEGLIESKDTNLK
jgi:hypothetical protein